MSFEWRITFVRMPTNFNPREVRFVRAENADQALAKCARLVERELGLAWSEFANINVEVARPLSREG